MTILVRDMHSARRNAHHAQVSTTIPGEFIKVFPRKNMKYKDPN